MNLAMLTPGEQGTITRLDAEIGAIRRRRLDMGVLPVEPVKVEKVAPLGDADQALYRAKDCGRNLVMAC